jgi:predicted TIM-barrel fold metal-dependent hydrolase
MISVNAAYATPIAAPRRPRVDPPEGATDCHAHVFGPYAEYPPQAGVGEIPPELPGETYLALLDAIGFSRGVLVQHRIFGADCGAMLRAIALAPDRLRGIALIDADVDDAVLEKLHRGGVRGVRFSTGGTGFSVGAPNPARLLEVAPKLAQFGWHAQILAEIENVVALAPRLAATGVPVVFENFGMVDPRGGVDQPLFRAVLRLLERGEIWLKLAAHRVSLRFPDYGDVAPLHRAAIAANPERLLWGTDWPHLRMADRTPDDGHLTDVFASWTDDPALRRRILVDNPARLYGFESGSTG